MKSKWILIWGYIILGLGIVIVAYMTMGFWFAAMLWMILGMAYTAYDYILYFVDVVEMFESDGWSMGLINFFGSSVIWPLGIIFNNSGLY